MNKMKLLVITGATAIGKSEIAIEIAEKLGGEIVSADSMQVYKGMDIGTAKPSIGDLRRIPHHLIDIVAPDEEFSVAEYQQMARGEIEDISKRGRLPILAGGSGLYIRAVIDRLDFLRAPWIPASERGSKRSCCGWARRPCMSGSEVWIRKPPPTSMPTTPVVWSGPSRLLNQQGVPFLRFKEDGAPENQSTTEN